MEDLERHDGSAEKPYYMSKGLMKILGKKNVKGGEDDEKTGCCRCCCCWWCADWWIYRLMMQTVLINRGVTLLLLNIHTIEIYDTFFSPTENFPCLSIASVYTLFSYKLTIQLVMSCVLKSAVCLSWISNIYNVMYDNNCRCFICLVLHSGFEYIVKII